MRQALEAPLFERALAGEERAVADVARQARAVARRALRRYFRCSQDVEDGAQEAVVRAITHLAQLRDIATFESWVGSIARRVALGRQRDSVTLPLDGLQAEAIPAPSNSGTRLHLELECAQERLCAARQHLLDLRYRQGLSYAEIAASLRTTVPVVRRRLQGAREQLRRETMRFMANEQGDAVRLSRNDLDCVYAAATLVDPDSEGSLRALHLSGRAVFGGTTHRGALGRLECKQELPGLRLDPTPLLDLVDRPEVSSACLGGDEDGARLALDDGTVICADHVACDALNAKAWGLADWALPHWAEASRAELLELAESIAGASWGGRHDAAVCGAASLGIIPGERGLIAASVFRPAPVSFTMSGQCGAFGEADTQLETFVNRAYLRDCLTALPRRAARVRVEFGDRLDALRFSVPDCPGLSVLMMPISDRDEWVRYETERRWPQKAE